MTFRRSRSALGSLRLFYRVDVVVFCEGGVALSHEDAIKPTKVGGTLDTLFWSNVAALGNNQKSLYFKSVGNKDTIKRILDDIIATGCETVSVCLDADYDDHLGAQISHPRAALTMGYSWESDVLLKPVAYQILLHLVGPAASDIQDELDKAIDLLERHLTKWCEIDIALKSKSKPCIIDRKKPLSVVDLEKFPPLLDEGRLKLKLSGLGYRTRPNSIVKISKDKVLNVVCGKLISKLFYNMVIALANRLTPRLRIDYESFMRIAVRETFTLIRSNQLPQLEKHLKQQALAFV